jgi:hypothetical protein
MSLDFFTEDWKKIPIPTKYFFTFGSFLILLTWLVDHWKEESQYRLFGWSFNNTFFSLGVATIVLAFMYLIFSQFVFWKRGYIYRRRYPLKDLNVTYNLLWLHGRQYLFDEKEKKYFHIHPYETSEDLLFSKLGFWVEGKINDERPPVQLAPGKTIDIKDYSDGGVINTRFK